ncbi:MAG: alginate export family protein [bacterium]
MRQIAFKTRFGILSVFCLSFLFSAHTVRPDSKKPLWVKVQGRLDSQGTLVVERMKQRKPGKQYVLEGILEKKIPGREAYLLAGMEIIPQADTKYTYINGTPASKNAVRKNVRIKAIGAFENSKFYAYKIRIFQYSDDEDIEVEGPISLVDTLEDGRKLFRVGSIMIFLKNGFRSSSPNEHTSALQSLSKFVNLKGKFQIVDNTRTTDIPEEELSSGSKRYGKLQTTFKTTFSEKVQGYSRIEFFLRDQNQTSPASSVDTSGNQGLDFRVRDLYLSLQDLLGIQGLQFRVGRQRFRDTRTWIMDRRLDAVQLSYARPNMKFTFAATRKLGERLKNRDQLHAIGSAYFRFGRGLKASFYAIKEVDERAGRDNPLWLAIQMRGKVSRVLEWWAQGARYSSQRQDVSILGFGTDAGLIVRPLSKRTGPFLSYHFAYGSADNAQTQNKNETFRQSRLQINYYKYGYQKRLSYYGSLLSPELSNLKFQALGLGYVFSRKVSVQGIWRVYEQVIASKTIHSNSLDIVPEGLDTGLGKDAEVILHLLPLKPLKLSFSAEWFFPGKAFSEQATTLFKLRSELIFYF